MGFRGPGAGLGGSQLLVACAASAVERGYRGGACGPAQEALLGSQLEPVVDAEATADRDSDRAAGGALPGQAHLGEGCVASFGAGVAQGVEPHGSCLPQRAKWGGTSAVRQVVSSLETCTSR